MSKPRNSSLATGIVLAVCYVLFGYNQVKGTEGSTTDDMQPYCHDHHKWSICVSPLIYGILGVDDGGSSADGTEIGAAIRVDNSVSNSVALTAGLTAGTWKDDNERRSSYVMDLGPTFIAPWRQHDRLYIGIGLAVIGVDDKSKGVDWGAGPRISLGMDYSLTRSVCMMLEGTAGFAYLGGQRSHGDVVSAIGNVAGWGRLSLGARFGL